MCHGTSQEVQWLGLNTSNAEGTGLIAAQGTKIVHAGPKVQKTFGVSELLMRDCRSVIKVMADLLFSFNETYFFPLVVTGINTVAVVEPSLNSEA